MTLDATQTQTPAPSPAPDSAASFASAEELRELVAAAKCVLFDFDGPLCRLFAGYRAEAAAAELVRQLAEHGLGNLLTAEEQAEADPHRVLRSVARHRPGSDLVTELAECLTQQELKAVPTAWPTPYADPLIRTWRATGVQLAVTTNNSPQAARSYLAGRGLDVCFSPHVYGRTGDLTLLKPDPYSLRRALGALGAEPSEALMLGDAATDLQAARAAGVPFLGYARNARKERVLREAGAEHLVGTLRPVLEAVRTVGGRRL